MHEGIAALFGLSGYQLIAVICGLIVLEELGIPMPFLPGDFLLVMAGVAIATGHVHPVVVTGGVYVSAVAGALAGREVFAGLGGAALRRVAGLLHVSDRVEGLSTRLRRGGSAAVFLGRITPGLRVVTTEISGLICVPRRVFAKGLLPAVAVYEGVFLGLGAWLGPAAWTTVERYAPRPGQVLLALVLLAALTVLSHTCAGYVRKHLALGLGAMGKDLG